MRIQIFLALALITAADAAEQGMWSNKDPATGFQSARLLAIAKDSDLVFHYYTESRFRCEVPGIAKRITGDGETRYAFFNTKEYWLLKGYEGYVAPETNNICKIEFRFLRDTVEIKSSGNCRSFCGAGGDLDSVLKLVSH